VLPGAVNSLFTQHLLEGFRGAVASEDGLVRIFDLFVPAAKSYPDQPNQHPVFKAQVEENFPVGLYLGGQKGLVPKNQEGFRYDAYISYVDKFRIRSGCGKPWCLGWKEPVFVLRFLVMSKSLAWKG
jgi:hypothetical protein